MAKAKEDTGKELAIQGTVMYQMIEYSNQQSSKMITLIENAINGGADVETLGKLMTLHERNEANQAKKAYTAAMTMFKSNRLIVEKDEHVRYEGKNNSVTEYFHATLANVLDVITPRLSENGLSVGWSHAQNEKGDLSVTCTITHILGHSEATTMTAPPDSSGGKNSLQAIGSTNSYLERYTVLALSGTATKDMDDDGRRGKIEEKKPGSGVKRKSDNKKSDDVITEPQGRLLISKLKKAKISPEAFMEHFKIDCIESLPKKSMNEALEAIDKKEIKELEPKGEKSSPPNDLDASEKSWK